MAVGGRGMFEAVADDEGAEMVKGAFAEFQGTHNSYCDVCGVGGELLCCETCSTVYHTACLLRPPGLSQALYCDRCREEAYAKAGKRPPRVSDDALLTSQVEEITNEFLPATLGNLGALDVMHRLVLRLARVREARIWEDGSLRRVCLALERASRPFARDVERHTCRDAALAELDFGPEGELFLAELHLEELLAGPAPGVEADAAGAGTAAAAGRGGAQGQQEQQGGKGREKHKSKGGGAMGEASPPLQQQHRTQTQVAQRHDVACDVFVARVLEALEVERRERERAEADGYGYGYGHGGQQHGAFSPEFLCRFAWLCTLLEASRGHAERALALLSECRRLLEGQQGQRLELPHCQRHPGLGLDVLDAKKKELTQRDEGGDLRLLVAAFRRGALAAGGTPTAQAARALLGLVRRRFLPPPPAAQGSQGAGAGRDPEHKSSLSTTPAPAPQDMAGRTEELLMDFLEHEVKPLLDFAAASHSSSSGARTAAAAAAAAASADAAARTKPPPMFCADVPAAPDKALRRHPSMVMVALCAAARLGDPRPAARLLHQALHYLLQTDRWGDRLVALYLRAVPSAPSLSPDQAARLKVALLGCLAQLLACVLGPAWPREDGGDQEAIQLPHDLGVRLPIIIASLVRHSSVPYSSAMLDAAVGIYTAMTAPTTTTTTTKGGAGGGRQGGGEEAETPAKREVGRAAERAVLRSLGAVVCGQLNPEFLLAYTNTADARLYCRRVLGYLVDLLEAPRLDLAVALTGPQLKALAAALVGLSRMVWAHASVFEVAVFPCFMALTALVFKVRACVLGRGAGLEGNVMACPSTLT